MDTILNATRYSLPLFGPLVLMAIGLLAMDARRNRARAKAASEDVQRFNQRRTIRANR